MSRFVVVEGPLRGKSFEVTELASIGRGEACAVRLEGKHVSRIHARLERRGESMVIRDNESRNGIYVNGRAVQEAILAPGDEVEIGEHVLVFDPPGEPPVEPRRGARVLATWADPFAPLGEPDPRLEPLLRQAAVIVGADAERDVAKRLLEACLATLPAERGFVMLQDPSGALRPMARKAPAGEEFFLSNVLQARLERERAAILARDVLRRPPRTGQAVGILAAPLATPGRFHGLLYLDAALPEGEEAPRFTRADLRFAAALSAFAATRVAHLARPNPLDGLGEKPLPDLRVAFEKECVVEALRRHGGNLDAAAKFLGLTRATLDEKLKVLGLLEAPSSAPPAR
jgi:pSer/pThr/pTyr-binding forkhead associated (FHA) protein